MRGRLRPSACNQAPPCAARAMRRRAPCDQVVLVGRLSWEAGDLAPLCSPTHVFDCTPARMFDCSPARLPSLPIHTRRGIRLGLYAHSLPIPCPLGARPSQVGWCFVFIIYAEACTLGPRSQSTQVPPALRLLSSFAPRLRPPSACPPPSLQPSEPTPTRLVGTVLRGARDLCLRSTVPVALRSLACRRPSRPPDHPDVDVRDRGCLLVGRHL